jgi:hypothetical protein
MPRIDIGMAAAAQTYFWAEPLKNNPRNREVFL